MNEDVQNSSVEESKDNTIEVVEETTKTDAKKESKTDEKKYSDKELNDISFKNSKKAEAKLLKDLGIDDVEEAKSILAKARAEKEANKSQDEKTMELTQARDEARIEAVNAKIENALLRKGVSETRIERAVRLIDKSNILDKDGKVDISKLNSEVEDTIKDFPELVTKNEEEKKVFKIGGDGKEDEKTDEISEMRKIMGLK